MAPGALLESRTSRPFRIKTTSFFVRDLVWSMRSSTSVLPVVAPIVKLLT